MIHIALFICYLISAFIFGMAVMKRWAIKIPSVLTFIGAWLFGTMIAVPLTYLFSVMSVHTGDSLLWGIVDVTCIMTILSAVVFSKKRSTKKMERGIRWNTSLSDVLLLLFTCVFSTWMMTKTFHGGTDGVLYVGSNNVFDFSHALGLIRSFSWGQNIPFSSPFQSGVPFFYHFLFYFYVGIWEYCGIPIVWAVNIPSILSMSALLAVIYFLPQVVLGRKPLTGWIAVFLSITNSTMTFWQLLMQKGISIATFRSMWSLPTYPFAGPFDGSTISIFTTLNSYVNQRHLAFAIAAGLFLFICVEKLSEEKHMTTWMSIMMGVMTGFLFYWNIFISFVAACIIGIGMMMKRQLGIAIVFGLTAAICVGMCLAPYLGVQHLAAWMVHQASGGNGGVISSHWTVFQYLWQNLGILPVVAGVGWFMLARQKRVAAMPFILLFITECAYAVTGHRGFDQKFFSFLIIPVNVLAAGGLVWFWEKKEMFLKMSAICAFGILIVSGCVDLIPIKNEFAFPLVDRTLAPVITWIRKETPRDAVFISYRDMLDPVVFAGRKNFDGFFGNVGSIDRTQIIRQMCSGDTNIVDASSVSYILISGKKKDGGGCTEEVAWTNAHVIRVYTDSTTDIYRLDK